MHSRCLAFFPFMFSGAGGARGDFFHISQLPNVFALCSLQVPNMFPSFVMFSLAYSPYHLTFIPYALENGTLLSPIQVGQRGGTTYFKIEPSVLGSLHSFIFLSNGPIKLASHKNKIKTRAKWPTQGQNAKKYANPKPKCSTIF